MFEVELKYNGVTQYKKTFEAPVRIEELTQGLEIPESGILSYKHNYKHYVGPTFQVTEDAVIDCISYSDPEGYRIYQDSALFIMTKAFYNIFPNNVKVVVEHSIGDGVYCEIFGMPQFTDADAIALSNEIQRIINENLPIEKVYVDFEEAEAIFTKQNRQDLLDNLNYYSTRKMSLFRCGEYYDFYVRPLARATGLIKEFEIRYYAPGFIFRFPPERECLIRQDFKVPKRLFATHQEHDKWLHILKVHNIIDLNKYIDDYRINDFILVEEALHEKKIAMIAEEIATKRKARIVLIAGPSSSGKTTFAKRLAVQLKVCGLSPMVLGMDDYFLPRTHTPRKPDGEFDFESIDSLDLPYLNEHLQLLLSGKEVELPKYNFTKGERERSNHRISLGPNSVLVMEGIHGLNEKLTSSVPFNQKVKIYVSALNQLNIDDHNRIPTTDCRKIRRMVRDYKYRGYAAEETLLRWPSVREGEDRNIFPFQEEADFIFNSGLTYELSVLKKHAAKLLASVSPFSPVYTEARRLLHILSHTKDIQDTGVPLNSILREFIGSSAFRY